MIKIHQMAEPEINMAGFRFSVMEAVAFTDPRGVDAMVTAGSGTSVVDVLDTVNDDDVLLPMLVIEPESRKNVSLTL